MADSGLFRDREHGVMHGVEMLHLNAIEQLQCSAHHLLPQSGVHREHGMGEFGVIFFDVAHNRQEELFHLVLRYFHPVSPFVGRFGEPPVVAVSGMKQCGAVVQLCNGAHPHICRMI